MKFLHRSRNYALKAVPLMKDDSDMDKFGVFGYDYKLPVEDEGNESDDEDA